MALSAGTRLGSYEIHTPLGAGGMGEVYRARDSRLNRDVAIKVLPDIFARNPERLARFEREAQVLASLNHPNIAHIHGLEESGDIRALVMELVEGEDLAQRIARAAVPLDEALPIARQIADALEAAHERGIVHRDLKPANVKVRPDGTVKVLDFGLAKALDPLTPSSSSSPEATLNSPTMTRHVTPGEMTAMGVILGTAAYMSPEQAAGRPVDRRADLWAFGVVLLEMLTGRAAFSGETSAHVIASVLKSEPDWSGLPADTPAPIRRLLRRCLEKDRRRRLDSAAGARLELDEALAPIEDDARTTGEALPASVWSRALPWVAALVLASAAGGAAWFVKDTTPQPLVRLALNLPSGQRLPVLSQPMLAISPDGRTLAYVAVQGQPPVQQLYIRPLESQDAKPVSGTEGAVGPFFSPDGQWIGFFAAGQLKKVSVTGGAAAALADAPSAGGASWSDRGTLAMQSRTTGQQGLQQISQNGGAPQALTRNEKGEFIQRWPEYLPGGHAVLFAASATGATWGFSNIVVEAIGKGERTTLAPGTQPRYVPTGHLLFAQSGTLMAAPFDVKRLALTGAAVPVVEGLAQFSTTGAAQYCLSSTGTLAYVPGKLDESKSRLVWVTRTGEEQRVTDALHNYVFPRVSPDGRRLAVEIIEREEQTWVYDIATDHLTRLAFEGNVNNIPAWSRDGKRIAFSSNRASVASNLYWALADGSGASERLTTSDHVNFPSSFSPDGQALAYIEVVPDTGTDLWVLRMSDRKGEPFLRTPFEETSPAFSPDGRWIAYSSNETGRREINVRPYPSGSGRWQISTEGGQEPVWNPKGGELFFRSGRKVMSVDIATKPGFSAGKPRVLFEGAYLPGGGFPFYDVSPDGQRFLMLKPVDMEAPSTQINIVLNWHQELKRLAAGQ